MIKNDLQSEWAFYGRKLDTIGHLYMRGSKLPAREPDILFFLLYTCGLLVNKKLTISGANFIHNNLEFSDEGWHETLNWEEKRRFSFPCRVIPYRGYAKSCISASLIFRNEPVFRFGHMGFGFFSNKKFFDFCAGGSVFGLIETIYLVHSKEAKEGSEDMRRRQNVEQRKTMQILFRACAILHRIDLGRELNQGNFKTVAALIYQEAAHDTYPLIKEEDRARWQPGVDRAAREYDRALEKRRAAAKTPDGEDRASEGAADCDPDDQEHPESDVAAPEGSEKAFMDADETLCTPRENGEAEGPDAPMNDGK